MVGYEERVGEDAGCPGSVREARHPLNARLICRAPDHLTRSFLGARTASLSDQHSGLASPNRYEKRYEQELLEKFAADRREPRAEVR